MTTGPSLEYVKRQLQSADDALSDARYLLRDGRLKGAANRAYYAMFYAVQAALEMDQAKRPKTHSGAIDLFARRFLKTGRLPAQFGKELANAFDMRQKSDYDVYSDVREERIAAAVGSADAFVQAVRALGGAGGR